MSRDIHAPSSNDGRGQGNELARAVVHPVTGEVLVAADIELETLSPDTLAEALLVAREHESQVRNVRVAIERELKARALRRESKRWLLERFEIAVKPVRESVWDPDELEATVRELVDRGVVDAGEWTDLIRHETIVSRSTAARLERQLSGAALDALKRCRTWRVDSTRTKLVVEPHRPLIQQN